jgi:hypothetical protein
MREDGNLHGCMNLCCDFNEKMDFVRSWSVPMLFVAAVFDFSRLRSGPLVFAQFYLVLVHGSNFCYQ